MDTTERNSAKHKKKDSSTDTEDLQTTEIEVSLLASINNKLDFLTVVHNKLKELRISIEYAYNQILVQANTEPQTTMDSVSNELDLVKNQNKSLQETVLDLQTRSMRDNLIFTGIQENAQDKPEELIKDFIKNQLKLTLDTVDKITFHRIGPKSNARPRPIVAKFEQFKQKELVKSRGRQLKGTTFGLNDQYPKEIQECRKILYPILKDSRNNNKQITTFSNR